MRTRCVPKSMTTAVSSSTVTTRPRPYLSWVTWSCTANTSGGGSSGGGLKGLVGRKRRVAARAGFIFLSMRVNTRRLVPWAEMRSDIYQEPPRAASIGRGSSGAETADQRQRQARGRAVDELGEASLAAAQLHERAPALGGRQALVEGARMPGERGQQDAAGPHVGDQDGVDRGRIAVQGRRRARGVARGGGLGRVLARQRARAEREADALTGPRFEQAGRVAGHDHVPPAQRGPLGPAAGEVAGVPDRRIAAESQAGDELSQVRLGGVALPAGGDNADREAVALGEDPAVGAGDLPPVKQQ